MDAAEEFRRLLCRVGEERAMDMVDDFGRLLVLIDEHGPRSAEVKRFVLETIKRDPEFEDVALMAILVREALGRLGEDDVS